MVATVINLEDVNPAVADVPAVTFWLPHDGFVGANLVDAVSGATIPVTNRTDNGDGSLTYRAIETEISDAIPAPGGADWAFVGVFHVLAGAIRMVQLGASAGHYISMSTSGCMVKGAVGTSVSLGNLATALRKVAIVCDRDGNTTLYQAAIGASLVAGAGTPVAASSHGDLSTDFTEFNAAGSIPDSNTLSYGVMLLNFGVGGLPADAVTAIDWMLEQAYANKKVLYPRLAEL